MREVMNTVLPDLLRPVTARRIVVSLTLASSAVVALVARLRVPAANRPKILLLISLSGVRIVNAG